MNHYGILIIREVFYDKLSESECFPSMRHPNCLTFQGAKWRHPSKWALNTLRLNFFYFFYFFFQIIDLSISVFHRNLPMVWIQRCTQRLMVYTEPLSYPLPWCTLLGGVEDRKDRRAFYQWERKRTPKKTQRFDIHTLNSGRCVREKLDTLLLGKWTNSQPFVKKHSVRIRTCGFPRSM